MSGGGSLLPLLFPLPPSAAFVAARCGLALRAKITAAAGNDRAQDRRFAAVAAFSFPPVSPMVALIFSRLAIGVKKIGNRRATHHNGFLKNVLKRLAQRRRLWPAKLGAEARRVNPCAPQTFVGINIADAAQHALVQQKCFDPGVARADPRGE